MFSMITIPYLKTGLGEFLSQHAVEIHVTKHHQAYIDNANKLIKGTEFEGKSIAEVIRGSSGGLFNNVAQHYNHCFFWKCLTDEQQEIPQELVEFFTQNFGSVDEFKKQFIDKASTLFGSGWCYLFKNQETLKYEIGQFSNAMNPLKNGNIPILTIDTWEHAWYINYENRKAEYFKNFWNYVNWNFVLENVKASAEKNPKIEL